MSSQDKDMLVCAFLSGALLLACLTGTIRIVYGITQLIRGARP